MNDICPVSPSNGRPYKSRKSRPCDFCRQRKVTCDMPHGPPCRRCSNRGHSCTFEEGPGPRKRAKIVDVFSDSLQALEQATSWGNALSHCQLGSLQWENEPSQSSPSFGEGMESACHHVNAQIVTNSPQSGICSPAHSISGYSSPDTQMPPAPASTIPHENLHSPGKSSIAVHSLENIPDAFSFYIGPTGVSDLQVLSDQPYDSQNISLPKVHGLRYRIMDSAFENHRGHGSGSPVVFGITDHALIEKAQPRLSSDTTQDVWIRLWDMVDQTAAWHLVQLYARYVDPYLPVVSKIQIPNCSSDISSMPLGLLTAMCATALPFIMYDETLYTLLLHPPQAEELYQLCWVALSQELHAPSLATLQACILLQQRLPTNMYLSDTAFAWTLVSTAVSVAQTIGVNRDPGNWISVPVWERNLRRRLWWATYIMEKWVALSRGMPSHLYDDDCDVLDLRPDDFDDSLSPQCLTTQTYLSHLAVLTAMLSDIQRGFYSVKATSKTANDLVYSLEVARPMRARLRAWRDNLPMHLKPKSDNVMVAGSSPGADELDGNGSLYLCYIVTHVALLRALLRPLSQWPAMALNNPENAGGTFNTAKAVIRGALICVKEFVEFVEKLTGAQWNSFWHSWSRPNFSVAGSFMIQLLNIVKPRNHDNNRLGLVSSMFNFDEDYNELQEWIRRWRRATRISANGAAGPKGLTNLAFIKVEALMGDLSNDIHN